MPLGGGGLPWWAFVLIAVGAVAVLGGIAAFLWQRRGRTAQPAVTTPAPKPAPPAAAVPPVSTAPAPAAAPPAPVEGSRWVASGGSAVDVPTLAVVGGAKAGQRFPVEEGLWIGRESDIDLEDEEISRRHAVVRPLDGSIEIRDVGSSNGTYVNGDRLSGARLLASGDSVELGQTKIKVWLPAAKEAPARRPRR